MLAEQIGEGFVCQFLKGAHPVAPQLLQLVERILIEGDQLPHGRVLQLAGSLAIKRGERQWFRDDYRSPQPPVQTGFEPLAEEPGATDIVELQRE